MNMFQIEVFAPGIKAEPKVCSGSEVTEELRQFGLEWKLADFFHDKTCVIVIKPHDPDKDATIAELQSKLDRIAGISGDEPR